MNELSRQFVHLSGAALVLFFWLFGQGFLGGLYFIALSMVFLGYSVYIRKQKSLLIKMIENAETAIREKVLRLERDGPSWKFSGAFWLYFACGIVFLVFPLWIAVMSCLVVMVADAFSTIVGMKGRRKVIGGKTAEGSIVFFLFSFLICAFFLENVPAILAAAVAMFAELIPDFGIFSGLKRKGLIDDNYTIPIITALFVFFFFGEAFF